MADTQRQPISVILCADDYAIAPGVSRAILDLIDRGRLSATSCMAASRFWPEHAEWLRSRIGRADIGLHLTLTDAAPLSAMPQLAPAGRLPSLGRLLALAELRRLDRSEVEREVDSQINRFISGLGRAPDYVDGHLHVHQLPIVREVVVDRIRRSLPRAYIRVCDEPVTAILRRGIAVRRAIVISALGRGLRRRVDAAGIPANRRFAGVRDFDEKVPYRDLVRAFLRDAPDGLLVMCHAGLADAELAAADRITTAREEEFRYLASDAFESDLAEAGVTLSTFSAAGSPGRSSAPG
ncbi:MAG TPA: ChbG/HpnK family deacetylase [Alphaproteobacteria bacterium]|nr:ChbG/HpnK family deacetylase [Alphaproteobacteria bacterium]